MLCRTGSGTGKLHGSAPLEFVFVHVHPWVMKKVIKGRIIRFLQRLSVRANAARDRAGVGTGAAKETADTSPGVVQVGGTNT